RISVLPAYRRHEALRAICMELSNDELLSHTFEGSGQRHACKVADGMFYPSRVTQFVINGSRGDGKDSYSLRA
ncbi:hypothetical protein ABTL20_21395, partial [Acinetobacter baumannii]